MLRITLLSGEELIRLPLTELSDVKALKRRLHQHHGLPPRFRQRLFNNGEILDDDFQLDSAMDLQVLIVSFCDASQDQRRELCAAAMDGRLAEVEAHLQLPMDPDCRDDESRLTPLIRASGDGHVDVAESLLEAGAQVDMIGLNEATALMAASCGGHTAMVELLLNAGADKNLYDGEDWTALMFASFEGHAPKFSSGTSFNLP
ncbi:unnamed protein product [Symbiodinium sp. KB8]|nr:unnamed protein product [Symbiodinium sp. KB8]